MKRFSEFTKKVKVYEADETDIEMPANLPENIKTDDQPEEGEVTNDKVTDNQSSTETVDVSKFFSKLFESREMAHIYHLQVKGDPGSHASHTALNDYYDAVLGLIDYIIESYQGQYGIIEEYDIIDTKETKSREVVEYFNLLATFIKGNRKCINQEDTHLHNIVDEIVALIYKTLYKLKYTK